MAAREDVGVALIESQNSRTGDVDKSRVEPVNKFSWSKIMQNEEWMSRIALIVCLFVLSVVLTVFIIALWPRGSHTETITDAPTVYTLPSEAHTAKNEDTSTARAAIILPVNKKEEDGSAQETEGPWKARGAIRFTPNPEKPDQFNHANTLQEIIEGTTEVTFETVETTESISEASETLETETTTFDAPTEPITSFEITPTTPETPTSTGFLDFYSSIDGEKADGCMERMALGSPSGVYPITAGKTFDAFCDMDTASGGWTVIQRRSDRNGSFHRKTMAEYVHGFGNLNGNHWLGLDKLGLMAPTNRAPATLRIELEGETCNEKCTKRFANSWVGEWHVQFGSKDDGYKITLGAMTSGNLTFNGLDPLFEGSNGVRFSTVDSDHDGNDFINCAQFRMLGAWWHGKSCSDVALNGYYQTLSEKYDTSDKNQNAKRYFVWGFDRQTYNGHPYVIHIRKSTMLLKGSF